MLNYLLTLRSELTGAVVNVSLGSNKTEAVVSLQDGLMDNQKYVYTVTTINNVGMVTSRHDGNIFCEHTAFIISGALFNEYFLVIQ